MRDLRTKGPQEQRSLQSLLAALGPVRSPDLSSLLDPTSGMSAVWSGQRKGALGRQGSRFTKSFEQEVAWLAQRTDVSAVANYFRVTWRSVRRIIQRVVAEQRDERRELDGLRVIGMDEISYRKRHKYLTVVIDHLSGPGRLGGKGAQGQDAAAVFPQARTTKSRGARSGQHGHVGAVHNCRRQKGSSGTGDL